MSEHDEKDHGAELAAVGNDTGRSTTETARRRSYAQIVVDAFTHAPDRVPVCLLHENLLNVRTVKAGTNVTLGLPSNVFTPNDALWFSREMGGGDSRKPKYIGVIAFIPTELYESQPLAAPSATTEVSSTTAASPALKADSHTVETYPDGTVRTRWELAPGAKDLDC